MRIPSDEASDLEWLLFEQCGVITWAQAVARLSPGRVRSLVATGRWQRPCRGVLVTHSGSLDTRQQVWVAVLGAGPSAVLAGLAAAREEGLKRVWTRRDNTIDIYIPRRRRAADLLRQLPVGMPAVLIHRTSYLPKQDRQHGRPVRTTIERSLVDAARWAASDDEARTILAAGCQQRLTAPAELLKVVDRMPTLRRRKLVRETLRDLAGGAEALSEIDLVRLCRRFGLPPPTMQERRKDASGRVRYLDAYWPQWHLHVEVDGAHHLDVAHWEADMRRQNDIWVKGDRILRFSSYQARRRPAEVAEQIRRALLAAGWSA